MLTGGDGDWREGVSYVLKVSRWFLDAAIGEGWVLLVSALRED